MLKMKNTTTNNAQELSKKEKRAGYYKKHYEANKEKKRAFSIAYNKANKEKKRAYGRAYYEANKETIAAKYAEWCKNNPGKQYKATKERLKKDYINKLKYLLRGAVLKAFQRIKQDKPTDTQSILGCTWEEAKAHFELLFQEGMTWENHGEWHVDHIRPVASFKKDELHLMNHISNLQPLWAKDNLSKGDAYN